MKAADATLCALPIEIRPVLTLPAYAETPEVCETEDNQEGPFYKPGAPLRSNLREHMSGVPFTLTGRVLGADGVQLSSKKNGVSLGTESGLFQITVGRA